MQISIDQCYLRGTESAMQRALKALEHARFPLVNESEYVILRELKVKSEYAQLGQAYALQSEKIIASRVYGWTDSALTADCIWFASETDMYACLCRDIAEGRAETIWFWKSFSRFIQSNISDSVSSLLQFQAGKMSALICQLDKHQVLTRVWQEITEQTAKSILSVSENNQISRIIDHAITAALPPQKNVDEIKLPLLLSTLLENNNHSPELLNAKHKLAVLLYLKIEKPHWLASSQSSDLIKQLVFQIRCKDSPQLSTERQAELDEKSKLVESNQASSRNNHQSTSHLENQHRAAVPTQSIKQNLSKIELSKPVININEGKINDENVVDIATENQTENLNKDPIVLEQQTENNETVSYQDEWIVSQGGVFYLLNILNQPWVRQHLLGDEKAIAFPSGWGWLYRLAEAFGLQHETTLIRCFSSLSGQDEDSFLNTMPELEASSEILNYARERYQHTAVWNETLLNRPAHISYLRPELNINFSIQGIDIDIRKSGLDIDPGWIDWLSTMVRFHYRDNIG